MTRKANSRAEYSINYRKFGRKMKDERIYRGWNMQRLADALDVSKEQLYKWEHREEEMPNNKIKQAEDLFNVRLRSKTYIRK